MLAAGGTVNAHVCARYATLHFETMLKQSLLSVNGGVLVLCAVREISAEHFHTCAVISDGMVRCWGADIFGQTTVPRHPLGVLTPPNDSACPVNDDCTPPYP